ncbi:MAG: glutamine synthetase [Emcibacteraceae bacterium]|nr:glutamine synthetase [Emcibacteraceae bacterium]
MKEPTMVPTEKMISTNAIEDNQHVKIGIVDLDGIIRGKYISNAKFKSALKNGASFCDVVLGWDREDTIIDGLNLTGWHTGFPDAPITIDQSTLRNLPLENGTPFYLANFAGKYTPYCPRSILKSVCDKAAEMGFHAFSGMEFEFTMFQETENSVREKNYNNLTPLSPGSNSYSVLRTSVASELYNEILTTCQEMNIPLEGLHEETGAGFMEVAISASSAIETADRAILFKNVMKTIAIRNELMVTFMAKWTMKEQGQSGHIHISLQNEDGTNIFYDDDNEFGISEKMRHFIGGQQKLMPEFLSLLAPTVNSFKRLNPDFWAPTWGSWGIDNRTVALRIIPGSEKSQRIEYRVPGADCNPYLAMAAVIASGLWGIKSKIEPTPISSGNAYSQVSPTELKLPASLSEAANLFVNSEAAEEFFDIGFINHYAKTRIAEEVKFNQAITDWELARYLETS